MKLQVVDLAWLKRVPPDAEDGGDVLVEVQGERWHLVATRVHPESGVNNALLRSADGARAAVAPMDLVKPVDLGVSEAGVDAAAWSLAGAFQGAVVLADEQPP